MSYMVAINYDPVWTALTWALENYPSYSMNLAMRHESYQRPEKIYYYFKEQKDAVFFALRWA